MARTKRWRGIDTTDDKDVDSIGIGHQLDLKRESPGI